MDKLQAMKKTAVWLISISFLSACVKPDYPDGLLRTSVEELSHFLPACMNGGQYKGTNILEPGKFIQYPRKNLQRFKKKLNLGRSFTIRIQLTRVSWLHAIPFPVQGSSTCNPAR